MADGYRYVTNEDLSALAQMVVEHAHASTDGFPAYFEPEPASRRGRFGRVKEEPVRFSVAFHAADPKQGGLGAMFSGPDGDIDLVASGAPIPPGWAPDPTFAGYLVSPAPDPAVTARWFLDTLTAMGATSATGRWRCYCPEMPEYWNDFS